MSGPSGTRRGPAARRRSRPRTRWTGCLPTHWPAPPVAGRDGGQNPAWAPALDIAEAKDAYLGTVEVPGVKLDDLENTLEDGLLTFQGERHVANNSSEEQFHRVERSSEPSAARSPCPPMSRPTRSRLRWRTACCAF